MKRLNTETLLIKARRPTVTSNTTKQIAPLFTDPETRTRSSQHKKKKISRSWEEIVFAENRFIKQCRISISITQGSADVQKLLERCL